MNVMFCIGSLTKGGAERVISNLANGFIGNKRCIAITKDNVKYKINNDVEICVLNPKMKKSFLSKNICIIRNLRLKITSFKPDAIVCFLNEPTMRVLFLKALHLINKNIKIIVSIRNDPQSLYNSKLMYVLMRILFRHADGFIFQTKEQRDYFSKKIQAKSTIIANPLKEEFIEDDKNVEKENVIINVGRLHKQKNQEMLIRAFNRIKDDFPSYKLKIYGTGSLQEELKNLIDKNNLKDRVILCGVTDNIKEELLKAKVFVLSSDYEGMPNALLEAMACGLACISTDCPCGGPRELIKNKENGILIPVRNEKKLAEELMNLLGNEKLITDLGNNAKKVKLTMNPKKINRQWEDYIKKVVSNEKDYIKNTIKT